MALISQLLLDFNKLYPEHDLYMWRKWPSFSQKICTLMKLEGMCVIFKCNKIFWKINFMIFYVN